MKLIRDRRLAHFDRSLLTETMGAIMAGRVPSDTGLPFEPVGNVVKTYALEVNGASTSDGIMQRLQAFSEASNLSVATTADETLLLLLGDDIGIFVDILDSRFWLLHSVSPSALVQKIVRTAVRSAPFFDWCWFPWRFLRHLQSEGQPRWFKSDFEGSDLLPSEGVAARRLRVQLEGDEAADLFDVLLEERRYRHATALTSVATRLEDGRLGIVDELSHFRGRFIARGDSFEMHVGFVSRAVQKYRAIVDRVEEAFGIKWEGTPEEGAVFRGKPLVIPFGRTVPNWDHFLSGLFSCRDPFRLWAIPRTVNEHYATAEAVDLHIGERLGMEMTPRWIRIFLPSSACGNTIVRLLTNLQHGYDATLDSDALAGLSEALV